MKLVILENYDKASEWAAKYVRNSILKFNPGPGKLFVLGLPTGINNMQPQLQCFCIFCDKVYRMKGQPIKLPNSFTIALECMQINKWKLGWYTTHNTWNL